ncbi:MAG: DUF2341 domain-containing protein [Candidatus Heimdallarchaeota archaeon]
MIIKKIRKRFFVISFMLLFFFINFYTISNLVDAKIEEESEINVKWWDTDWSECQGIEIYNPGNRLFNYTVPITFDSSNFNYTKVQENGGDIRFLHSNNYTLLNHWIENWDTSGSSKIWVQIPYIESHDLISIYLYYGNDLATSMSDGNLVFTFFEDFSETLDPSKWFIHEYTADVHSYSFDDGLMQVHVENNQSGVSGYAFETIEIPDLTNFEVYMKASWKNFHHDQGQGKWCGIRLQEVFNKPTGTALGIGALEEITYTIWMDELSTAFYFDDHYSSGNTIFKIRSSGNDFNTSLSGTYNHDYNFHTDNFSCPFTLFLDQNFHSCEGLEISIDVCYDYLYIRETENTHDLQVTVKLPITEAVSWRAVPIFSLSLITIILCYRRKRK